MSAVPPARPQLLPVLAVAALLLGLLAQALIPLPTVLPEIGPSRAVPVRPAAVALPVAAPAIIAAQTLFAPARRPGVPGAGTATGPGAVLADAFAGSTLTGTARAGGFAVALLRDGAGHARQMRVGDRIGAWRLLAIVRDGASFGNGATRRLLGVGETAVVQPPPAQTSPEVDSQ